ncbi:MAG TPA: MFS transporter [Candidatus Binataceae bacterium]|nr:MFS transporter [Candidatus Binataceae bacterium]
MASVSPVVASAAPARLKRSLIFIMALATASAVANLYYCQPLLADIGRTFHLNARHASAIAMMSQIGYAIGLFWFVPLGDMLERRRLIITLLMAVNVTLVVAALSPNAATLYVASLLIGAFAAVVQVVLPFAATLAAPQERGQVVGFVTSGLLIGILLSRSVSGLIGGHFGWRTMYWTAAAVMAVITLLLRFLLPQGFPTQKIRYGELVRSLGHLIREQPQLRETAMIGAFCFASVAGFWSTLVFFVGQSPYHYGAAKAGLFGLAGAAGASIAPAVGRLADRRSPRITTAFGLSLGLLSWLVLGFLGHHLLGLIVGVVLLDLAAQSNHVSNLTTIYALLPHARSRLNTVYMVSYFCGGAVGTLTAANAWVMMGWRGVATAGFVFFGLAMAVFLRGSFRRRYGRWHAPQPSHAG